MNLSDSLISDSFHSDHVVYLSQIFYPRDLFQDFHHHDGFLIGWNLDNFRCCIAACVRIESIDHDDKQVHRIDKALKHAISDLQQSLQYCSSNMPIILGKWKHRIDDSYTPSVSEQGASIWITLHGLKDSLEGTPKPILQSVYSSGSIYYTTSYMIDFPYLDTDTLNFMSMESRSKVSEDLSASLSQGPRNGNIMADMDIIVRHMNACHDLQGRLFYHLDQSNISMNIFSSSESSLSQRASIEVIDRGRSFPLITSILISICHVFDLVISFLLLCLESKHLFSWWSMGQFLAQWVGLRGNDGIGNDPFILGVSLSEISLAAVYLREKCICYKLILFETIIFMKSWSKPPSKRIQIWRDVRRIIYFIWLDKLLGLVVGWTIYRHMEDIISLVYHLYIMIEKKYLFETILSFNDNPLGIKLNSVITRRIGSALIYLIRIYEYIVLHYVSVLHRPIMICIACIGSLGLTIQSMVIVDIIRLSTLHISLFHRCFGVQHKYQIELISSLFYLFSGQKKNILRNRIDSCEYDSNQLLFGIALFTMMIFLFPTFVVYFYLFAIFDLFIVLGNYLLWIFVVCIKEFPYFSLMAVCSACAMNCVYLLWLCFKYLDLRHGKDTNYLQYHQIVQKYLQTQADGIIFQLIKISPMMPPVLTDYHQHSQLLYQMRHKNQSKEVETVYQTRKSSPISVLKKQSMILSQKRHNSSPSSRHISISEEKEIIRYNPEEYLSMNMNQRSKSYQWSSFISKDRRHIESIDSNRSDDSQSIHPPHSLGYEDEQPTESTIDDYEKDQDIHEQSLIADNLSDELSPGEGNRPTASDLIIESMDRDAGDIIHTNNMIDTSSYESQEKVELDQYQSPRGHDSDGNDSDENGSVGTDSLHNEWLQRRHQGHSTTNNENPYLFSKEINQNHQIRRHSYDKLKQTTQTNDPRDRYMNRSKYPHETHSKTSYERNSFLISKLLRQKHSYRSMNVSNVANGNSLLNNSGSTIYLSLSQKTYCLAHFYLPYANYWEYFIKEKG